MLIPPGLAAVISATGAEGCEMERQVSIFGEAVQNSSHFFFTQRVELLSDSCGGEHFSGK